MLGRSTIRTIFLFQKVTEKYRKIKKIIMQKIILGYAMSIHYKDNLLVSKSNKKYREMKKNYI